VTAELKRFNQAGVKWSDMAIFYRMNALSRVMEDALRKSGVPYQIAAAWNSITARNQGCAGVPAGDRQSER